MDKTKSRLPSGTRHQKRGEQAQAFLCRNQTRTTTIVLADSDGFLLFRNHYGFIL